MGMACATLSHSRSCASMYVTEYFFLPRAFPKLVKSFVACISKRQIFPEHLLHIFSAIWLSSCTFSLCSHLSSLISLFIAFSSLVENRQESAPQDAFHIHHNGLYWINGFGAKLWSSVRESDVCFRDMLYVERKTPHPLMPV